MKNVFILIILSFLTCHSTNYKIQDKDAIYIYFKKNDKDMISHYSWKNGPLKYVYVLEKGTVIFETKIKDQHNFQLPVSKANRVDIKNMDWLNKNTNKGLEYYAYKFFRQKEDIYIVITDTINKKLNFVRVNFIQEIE